MGFHPEGVGRHKPRSRTGPRRRRGCATGHAHAALVFDGDRCVGWCQFGPTDELPRIKHKRAYLAGAWTRSRTGASRASSSTSEHRQAGRRRPPRSAGALDGDRAARRRDGRELPRGRSTAARSPSSFLHNGTAGAVRAPRVRAHPPDSASATGWSERPYDEEALTAAGRGGCAPQRRRRRSDAAVGTASQVAVDDTGETARRRLGRRRSLSSSPGRAWVSSSTRPRARSAISR